MKKRVISLLMVAAMATGMFAGCGSKNEGESSSAAAETTTAGAEETTDAAEETTVGEAEKVQLTVWSPSEDQAAESGEWLQTMCEQFDELHPEWEIEFTYGVCAEGEAKATVTQDVEGAADVYMFANDNLTALIAANGIAKLGGEALEAVQNTNSQTLIDSVSVDGSVYGVPFTSNTWFMFYDKSVFTEDDIKSLDAMLEKGKVSFPITNSWYIASFYAANGCTLFGEGGTDEAAGIDFSGDKAVAVTEYLVNLAANPNFVSDADGAGMSGLRDGSISAMFSGSWDAAAVQEALGENYGVAQLPAITIDGEEKLMKAFAGSKAIGVNPTSEYPQVAVALASYLGSAEAQLAHYELRSVIPCNTELLADEAISQDVVVAAQGATIENTAIVQPFVSAMDLYWSPAENFGKAIVNGEVTLDNAAEKTEQLNTSMNTSVVE